MFSLKLNMLYKFIQTEEADCKFDLSDSPVAAVCLFPFAT